MNRNIKLFGGLVTMGALALTGCAPAADDGGGAAEAIDATELDGAVHYLIPTETIIRWETFDRPAFEDAMSKVAPDMQVAMLNGDGRVQQQMDQVQSALAEGSEAIVLVAVDPNQAAGALSAAAADNVPVICSSHACNGGPAYAYVTTDFYEIGEVQGAILAEEAAAHFEETGEALRVANMYGDPSFPMYVDIVEGKEAILQDSLDEGHLEIVCQEDALDWLPANAQDGMENCLTRTDDELDAIFVMNDDIGTASLAATTAAGLEDVKLYGGFDATIEGVRRVAAGQQAATMSIDYASFNETIADLVVTAIQGEPVPEDLVSATIDNGSEEEIPHVEQTNAVINSEDSIEKEIIETGIYTKEDICLEGAASESSFCAN